MNTLVDLGGLHIFKLKKQKLKIVYLTWSQLNISQAPVHTYADIFENGGFFLRFWKKSSPHVAYSNRFRPSTRGPDYHVIVFENLRFHPSTRKRRFQKPLLWRAFSKTFVFACWKRTPFTCGRNAKTEKKTSVFKNILIRVDGA